MELYHAKTWLGKYVFSQDAKTIAIQYAATAIAIGMVALVLSWFMRLQLAWPNTFTFIDPAYYLQAVTMHGMIMVVYLLTALFLGGFGNYLIPLMVGARDMVSGSIMDSPQRQTNSKSISDSCALQRCSLLLCWSRP